jgi:hypothetical protein
MLERAQRWDGIYAIVLAANYGFAVRELNELDRLIAEHQTELLEAWNDYFGQA